MKTVSTLLAGYLAIAVLVIALGVRLSKPGPTRVFVFATLFSLFFAVGFVAGHGLLPVPGLPIMTLCLFSDCSEFYGNSRQMLRMTALPMAVQWLMVLGLSYLIFAIRRLLCSMRG